MKIDISLVSEDHMGGFDGLTDISCDYVKLDYGKRKYLYEVSTLEGKVLMSFLKDAAEEDPEFMNGINKEITLTKECKCGECFMIKQMITKTEMEYSKHKCK